MSQGQIGRNLVQVLAQGSNVAGMKVAHGTHTTVAASDEIDTGLDEVLSVQATLKSDPVAAASAVTAVAGNGGAITIKTWKPTASGDTAPTAATTFGKEVAWIAIGR